MPTDAEIYEAALERRNNATAELHRARHLLELAELEETQAEDALAALEAHPGVPAYLHANPCPMTGALR